MGKKFFLQNYFVFFEDSSNKHGKNIWKVRKLGSVRFGSSSRFKTQLVQVRDSETRLVLSSIKSCSDPCLKKVKKIFLDPPQYGTCICSLFKKMNLREMKKPLEIRRFSWAKFSLGTFATLSKRSYFFKKKTLKCSVLERAGCLPKAFRMNLLFFLVIFQQISRGSPLLGRGVKTPTSVSPPFAECL